MKFAKSACIDAMYTELPFIERIVAAKKDGFEYIEFWGWPDKNIDEIKKIVQEVNIGISGFNGDAELSLIDPEQKKDYLAYLSASIEVAKKLGSKAITIHSNGLGDQGIVIDDYINLSTTVKTCAMFDTLLTCAELAEKNNIQMNLEPLNIKHDHVGNYLATTKMAAEMTRLINSPKLKVLYDIYHMQINEGDICVNLSEFIDQIGHIHVADNPGRHEPGTGEINYKFVFEYLEKIGYKGIIGYELFPETTTAKAVKAIMSY
ncbi:hydroxypyruvate isomerase family protein [Gilliamella sp. wkB112]|uniref:hydroxypyruvate isomerase family protein n=1 Tax=Gilliamella sp. wkB112 TaxID=3120257 RepID=UPI00080E6B29|nr:TIM barrel protein [Gilliamella apicola]OCG00350.1 AP endonuclease [Gilliamella apicola]